MAQVFNPAIPTYGYAIIAVPFTAEAAPAGGVLDHGAVKAAVGNVALPAGSVVPGAGSVQLPEGTVAAQPVLAKKVF